ncbi:MAG: hypothetical protein IKV27_03595, partial [Lachnospiraceae bacterium]|nr:hypothetical protein [Lachnospiraceae bacterium]
MDCFEINDIFVCGPNFEKKPSYLWEELTELPLILLEKNAISRRYLEKNFKEKNISLHPQIEVAVHDLLIRFASIHLGVSCVIEEFSKEELEDCIKGAYGTKFDEMGVCPLHYTDDKVAVMELYHG